MFKKILIGFMVVTIPLCLGAVVWQSTRYAALEKELVTLEKQQAQYIEENKRLQTEIAVLSSPERIEQMAKENPGLVKKTPEEIMQVVVE
jgi:cell division protein FtsL